MSRDGIIVRPVETRDMGRVCTACYGEATYVLILPTGEVSTSATILCGTCLGVLAGRVIADSLRRP